MHLPTEVQKMNHSLVHIAHKTAQTDPHLTSLLLGSGLSIANTFAALSTQQIYALSHVRLPLFQLRNASDTVFWTRLLRLLMEDDSEELKALYGALLLNMADFKDLADSLSLTKPGGIRS